MEEAPVAQIPITVDFQNMVILPPAIAQHFTAARGELACAVGHSLASPLPPEGSELCTALMEHAVVVSLLLALDGALPSRLRIGCEGSARHGLVGRALHDLVRMFGHVCPFLSPNTPF